MCSVTAVVRRKWGERPIQIIYEDQSSNDFNSLFKRIHGKRLEALSLSLSLSVWVCVRVRVYVCVFVCLCEYVCACVASAS